MAVKTFGKVLSKELRHAAKGLDNKDRILLYLYAYETVSSDFDLSSFASAVRKVFPPALYSGYRVSNYEDFGATVRFTLGQMKNEKWARNAEWGIWKLSSSGRVRARKLARSAGLSIGKRKKKGGSSSGRDKKSSSRRSPQRAPRLSQKEIERLSEEEIIKRLSEPPAEGRNISFLLPKTGKSDNCAPFIHQQECLDAIAKNEPLSGIVHLPTGAGKTAVALWHMARFLREDPNNRVLWVSGKKQVVRQSMGRLVEMAGKFPRGTRFIWGGTQSLNRPDVFRDHQVVFATQDGLRKMLEATGKDLRKAKNGLGISLAKPLGRGGHRLLVVYDECHEFQAQKLRTLWRRTLGKTSTGGGRLRVLGLSATPMPNDVNAVRFLSRIVFPNQGEGVPHGEKPNWGVLVHNSASNNELVNRGILSKVNLHLQNSGRFRIPTKVLRSTGCDSIDEPKKNLMEVEKFAKQFNKDVMSSDEVLEWLADRLAAEFRELGKTLVFVPSIKAANKLTGLLIEDDRVGKGNVTVVHSKLSEADHEGQLDDFHGATMQIDAFVKRKNSPCIMVNVGMLTTGFDDPCIRTVVLARLTFSTNLFWQMIGRGLRGPTIPGGTYDCQIVDPIHLTKKFNHLEGYRPRFTGAAFTELEKGSARLQTDKMQPPQVPTISIPPMPPYGVEVTVPRELGKKVVTALKEFLKTGRLPPEMAASIVNTTQVVHDEHGYRYEPRPEGGTEESKLFHFKDAVEKLAQKSNRSLSWLLSPKHLPEPITDVQIELFYADLQDVAENEKIETEDDWARFCLERRRS